MMMDLPKQPKASESANFQPFNLCDDDKAKLMALGFVRRQYPPQHVITQQGDNEDRSFIVQSGWASICKDLPGGERQIADLALPGDVVGLRAGSGESHKTFTSITEIVVFEARAQAVIAAFAASDGLAAMLFSAVSRQRAILIEHMANLGRRAAAVRTGHFLLEIRERLKTAGVDARDGYECPLTQYDLADALGLTAIHVNRMLRELRERGYLSFRYGVVEFHNPIGLANFCGFDPHYLR